jgi:hypothetical protein
MAGWNTIKHIRSIEEHADLLGMKLAPYRHDDRYGENVALVPKDQDTLPIYTRDAILFAGSLEGADHFMQGVFWAREYDLFTIDKNLNTKRARKEQDLRNKQLMEIIKNSDKRGKNETV